MRLPREAIRAIDDVRRADERIPTRTEIIREAVLFWLREWQKGR